MKNTLLLLCLLLGVTRQISAQGKWLNSPENYMGTRPLYNDTLSIDFENGERMEIIYRWFDLFRENEADYQKYFRKPFESKYLLLQEKIKALPLNDAVKYHISLTSRREQHFKLQNALHNNDIDTLKAIYLHRPSADSLLKGLNNDDKKAYKDSMRQRMEDYFSGRYPLRSTLTVTERTEQAVRHEYKLEGNQLTGRAQWQHILEVDNRWWKVRFYVNAIHDLSAFNSVDLNQFIRSEKEIFLRKRYYLYHSNLNYKVIDGEIKYQYAPFERRIKRTAHVALRIYPTVGTSVVKGKWSTDMGFIAGMTFNDKQQGALRVGLRYQLKGLGEETTGDAVMSYNGFVDGIMDFNFGEDYKRAQWLGAGLGYLVHQSGGVYGKNTGRIFLKYRSSQLWGIQPEYNYSFNDNKGFIGLGVFFSL